MANGESGTQAATPPDGEKSKLPLILGAVVAAIAVGVGGYVIGHSAADASGKENEGYKKGVAAANAQYAEGQPKYDAIYKKGAAAGTSSGQRTGQAQGKKAGFEKGQQAGEVQGEAQGVTNGASAALGGLTDWQSGAFYIVAGGPGPTNVAFAINQRKLMSPNERYSICADNPADICVEPNS